MEAKNGEAKIVAGVIFGGVALACLFWTRLSLFLLLLVLALVASGELLRLARARGARPVPIVALGAVAAAFLVAYREGAGAPEDLPAVVAAALVLAGAQILARSDRSGAVVGLAATAFVVVYVGVMGSFMVTMRELPGGFRVALVFGLMVVLNDVGAWALGRSIGRRPMAPRISAAKTWEGWLGGTVTTFVVGILAGAGLDPPMTVGRSLVLAGLVAIAAPLGDLFESLLKRDFGVKDSGSVIPAHGGALDRLDSLLFTAPAYFYAFRALAS